MSFTLIVAALLPALLIVWYLVRRDLYPEPPAVVVGAFLLGGLMVIPAAFAAGSVRPAIAGVDHVTLAALIYTFVVIAPLEELAKFGVLAGFAGRRTVFNEPMDGMVYGGVVGLGFAAVENLAYVAVGGLELAVLRGITAVPMHAAIGAIMGFFYGLARFIPERRAGSLCCALLVPIGLHGAYNFPLVLNEILAALGEASRWLEPLALAVLAFQIGLALALLRRLRLAQRAGHHEAAAAPDFLTVDARFKRFSTARHLKGPIAVVAGGVLTWLSGTMILTLLAGLFGTLMDAPRGTPFGNARTNAADLLDTAPQFGHIAITLSLVLLLVFGLGLFVRGIAWLNRQDRALDQQPASPGSLQ